MNFKTLLAVAAMAFGGCSGDKPTLYVYNWMDYIDPEVISGFEAENGCRVVVDGFDDNEQAISKLLAGGGGYDVVFPSSYAIGTMVANGLVQRLDPSRLGCVLENFDRKYARHLLSTNMEWSVPYAFSMTGYAYRSDKVPSDETFSSWLSVTNAALNYRVCLLNDMREILGIGLLLNGHSVNSTNRAEIMESAETMRSLKPFISRLDNTQYKSGLVSAEFYVGMGYNSDVMQVIQSEPDSAIRFTIPNEGSTCCFDEMVLMAGARNPELAYKFMNYLYRPRVAAKNAVYICTAVPNRNMFDFMSDDDRRLIDIPEDVLVRLELLRDVGGSLSFYNEAWDRFKSTRE